MCGCTFGYCMTARSQQLSFPTHTHSRNPPIHFSRQLFPGLFSARSVLLRQSWETGKANKVAVIGSWIPLSVYDLSLFDSHLADTLDGSLCFHVEAGRKPCYSISHFLPLFQKMLRFCGFLGISYL